MARPKKEISEELVRDLASIMCTQEEIATVCKCSVDTLDRRFAEVIKEGRQEGKTSLRRYQFLAAQKGNTAMLIWLGKQHLDQKEKQEIRHEGSAIQINIDKDDELA